MFDSKKIMDMIKKASKAQNSINSKLKNIEVEGFAGGDMVHVYMNAQFEVLKINIDPILLNKNEIKFLEDLLIAAINNALVKAKEASASKMKLLASELNL
jgi:hypothetical protein